jgi:hypothetical protein
MNRRDLMLLSPALLLTGCSDKEGDVFRELQQRVRASKDGKVKADQVASQCFAIYMTMRSLYALGPRDADDYNPHVDKLKTVKFSETKDKAKEYYVPTPPAGYETVYTNIAARLNADKQFEQQVRFGLGAFMDALQLIVGAALGTPDNPYPGGNPENCFDSRTIDALANRGLLNPAP